MENASKAIIIAGAVLIAVIIISIAMWLVNTLREYNSNAVYQAKSADIEAFNRYFIYSATGRSDGRYIDGGYQASVTGAEMIGLIGKARDYFLIYQDPDHAIAVAVSGVHFSDNNLTSALTHFVGNNIIASIPDTDWNNFVKLAKNSSDSLLFDRSITYTCTYSNTTGRINSIRFSM